jgi:2-oxoglutarate ferredoxin oxidoreductase subunit gamma
MQTEVILSGFGGQGVLFAGQLLAYAGLDSNRQVTWFPSYGPEMRGGTAHCTVIVGDEEIGSPVVKRPSAVVVMNIPSLEKYEPLVREGGLLVVNSSLVDREPTREDIDVVIVPANEIAEEIGDRRYANMVMTGALLERSKLFSVDEIGEALMKHIPERHRDKIADNLEALRRGAEIAG